MSAHATLKEADFRRLIAGETVVVDGMGELILADIGYVRMTALIAECLGATTLMYRTDVDELVTIYRTADGAWSGVCSDHDWATGGTVKFVGETLGAHLQEEHEFLRAEDWTDILVAVLYGLCGHSRAACERSE